MCGRSNSWSDMQKEISNYFPLGVGEQSEIVGVIMGLCKAEGHAKVVSALQVGNEIGRQMESHPIGVEKTEAAVAAVKLAHGNTSPILLLITGAVTSESSFVFVVINALHLLKPDSAARSYAGKRFSDFVAESCVHGACVACTAEFALAFVSMAL